MLKIFAVVLFLGLMSSPRAIFVENAATAGLTAVDLAGLLVGDNVSISNVSWDADPRGIGRYRNEVVEVQGIKWLENGIVLGTGMVDSLNKNINSADDITGTFPRLGDADLTTLLPPNSITADASVLEFDFFALGEGPMDVSFQYLFGSDEYDEWTGSVYNDIFGFFLDKNNIATIPGTTTPVTINNINLSTNSDLYQSNDRSNGIPTPIQTEMDGFTIPLSVEFTVAGGSKHHLKIAIADAEDFRYDSWVFISSGSFSAHNAATVPEPMTGGLLGVGLLVLIAGRIFLQRRAL